MWTDNTDSINQIKYVFGLMKPPLEERTQKYLACQIETKC